MFHFDVGQLDCLYTLCKVGKLGPVTTNRFKWAVNVGMFIWLATAKCQSWGSVWIALDGRSPAIHGWCRYVPNSDTWCPGQYRLEGETEPCTEISIANENQQVWLCTSGALSNSSSPMPVSTSTRLEAPLTKSTRLVSLFLSSTSSFLGPSSWSAIRLPCGRNRSSCASPSISWLGSDETVWGL